MIRMVIMDIEYRASDDAQVVTIVIPTDFNFRYSKGLRESYLTQKNNVAYILDFSKTEYIDSTALGMLLLMREEVLAREGKVKIVNCREKIMDLLVMSNFHQLFNVA